jgi:hypothetical protein
LGANAQNVTGGTGDDTVNTGLFTTLGVIDLGSGSDTLNISVDTTGTGISTVTMTSVDAITLASNVNATMTIQQNSWITTATGINIVTLTEAATAAGAAEVESYVLKDGVNDFTLGAIGQDVTSAGGFAADTIRTGALLSFSGTTLTLDDANDTLVVTTTGTDLSLINTGDATTAETLSMNGIAAVSMTIAQHTAFTTITADGTVEDDDSETITFTTAALAADEAADVVQTKGNAAVEAYVLADIAGNDFELGAEGQDVTSAGTLAADTIRTGALLSFSGTTLALADANDTLVVTTTGTNLSGINAGAATTAETLTMNGMAAVSMTFAQHNALTTINASGTGITAETITLTTTDPDNSSLTPGAIQGNAAVETYVLAGEQGEDGFITNKFTLGASAQNVTGGTGYDIVNTGAITTVTGKISLNDEQIFDVFNISIDTTGTGISTAKLTGVDAITLASGVDATMTREQNDWITTAEGTNIVTLSDAGTATGKLEVEEYVLADAAGNSFTLGANDQEVTGTGTQNDTVHTGAITTVTGRIALGLGADTLNISIDTTGTCLSTAELMCVVAITLASGVDAKMTIAQNALITTAAGTNIVTLSDAGTATGKAAVESYVLANGVNTFTLGTTGQNVTGGTGADTVNTGSITEVTGTFNFASGTLADTLNISVDTTGTGISTATLNSVDAITLASNVDATMTIAQNALITTATDTNIVTLTDAGTTTGAAEVESYVLANLASNDFTLGAIGQDVTSTGALAADTIRTGALNTFSGTTLALANLDDTLVVTTTGTKLSGINAGALTTAETLTMNGIAAVSMTIAQHNAFTTINASGTGSTAETITLTDAGTATGKAAIENYVLADGTNTFTLGANDQNIAATGGRLLINAANFELGYISDVGPFNNITLDMTNGGAAATLLKLDGDSLANVDTLKLTGLQANDVTDWASIDWYGGGSAANITNFIGGLDIRASAGNQLLTGSASSDVIATGLGADSVNLGAIGGGGNDAVVYSSLEANDVNITGFTTGSGAGYDILNFANLTLGHGTSGNNVVFSKFTNAADMANVTVIGFNTLKQDTADNLSTAIDLAVGNLGAGSQMIFLAANSENTAIGVWAWQDATNNATAGRVDASELTKIGQLQGYSDALVAMTEMNASNFSHTYIA